MLTFEEKVMTLGLIRAIGLNRAVIIVARHKKYPAPSIREELMELDTTHYLLDDGFVEKTSSGVVQYVEFTCPQQPTALTKEYFNKCRKPKQELFLEAFAVLSISHLLAPAPIPVRKYKFEKE